MHSICLTNTMQEEEVMENQADYREMYLHLMRETEKTIRILTEAQRRCEELYLDSTEPTASSAARLAEKRAGA